MTLLTQTTDPQGEPMEPISDDSAVSLRLVFGLVSLVVAILFAYNALDKRISAMEDRTRTVQSDIAEMKADLKTLLRNQQ